MLEDLASYLESRLSRQGRFVLRVLITVLVIGLLFYFLNYLRLGYLGALSDAANAVE